jgi:hypothetical protein
MLEEDILDRCEMMKWGDLEPNGWCRAHKETWYLVNGAEQMETWYLMDGAEQNKTRVLLAGKDSDGVGKKNIQTLSILSSL